MKTELYTVSRIFTEALYRIPEFQRGYSWGLNQLRDFWLDLEQLQNDGKHYTGVLTLEDVPKNRWAEWEDDNWLIQSRRFKPYYVVDGQQRLTAVAILIQAILEKTKLSQLNFTELKDIKRKYILETSADGNEKSYVFGYEKDNPSYEFLKTRIFIEKSSVHSPNEDTIYTKNLIAAKTFFEEQLADISDIDLAVLYTKVTQQLVFNVYEISSDIDVCVTFETMNNRGKPLSTLELLKNRLIFLSTKLVKSKLRDSTLRRKINEAWKAVYHYLGKNDQRPLNDDQFLRTHLAYYYMTNLSSLKGKTDGERDREIGRYRATMEEFSRFLLNDLFTPKRIGAKCADCPDLPDLPELSREFIAEFSQNLKNSVELYYKLSTPAESNFSDQEKMYLERLGRIRSYSPPSLLLAIYQQENNSEKRIKCLEQIERMSFFCTFGQRNPYMNGRVIFRDDPFIQYAIGDISTEQLTTLYFNVIVEQFKEMSLQ